VRPVFCIDHDVRPSQILGLAKLRAMILEMAEYEGASCSWGDSLD